MKATLISMLISTLLKLLSPELVEQFAKQAIEFIENFVLGTASDVDDRIVLPLLEMIEAAFDLKD